MRGRQMRQQQDLRKQMYELKNKPDALDAARLALVNAQTNALIDKPETAGAESRYKTLSDIVKSISNEDQAIRKELADLPLPTAYRTARSKIQDVNKKVDYLAGLYDALPETVRLRGVSGRDWVKSQIPSWQLSTLLDTDEADPVKYRKLGLPYKEMSIPLTDEYNKLVSEMASGVLPEDQKETMWSGFYQRALQNGLSDIEIARLFPYAAPVRQLTRMVPTATGPFQPVTGTANRFSEGFGILGQEQLINEPGGGQRVYTRQLPEGLVGTPDKDFLSGLTAGSLSPFVADDIRARHQRTFLGNIGDYETARMFSNIPLPMLDPARSFVNSFGNLTQYKKDVPEKLATKRAEEAITPLQPAFNELFNRDVMDSLGIQDPAEYQTAEGFTKGLQYVLRANPELNANVAIRALPKYLQTGQLVSAPVEMKPETYFEKPMVQPSAEATAKLNQMVAQTRLTNLQSDLKEIEKVVDAASQEADIQGRIQAPGIKAALAELEQMKFSDMQSWRKFMRWYMEGMLGVNQGRLALSRDELEKIKLPEMFGKFAQMQFMAANQHTMTMTEIEKQVAAYASMPGAIDSGLVGQISTTMQLLRNPNLTAQARAQLQARLQGLSSGNATLTGLLTRYMQQGDMLNARYGDATRAAAAAEAMQAKSYSGGGNYQDLGVSNAFSSIPTATYGDNTWALRRDPSTGVQNPYLSQPFPGLGLEYGPPSVAGSLPVPSGRVRQWRPGVPIGPGVSLPPPTNSGTGGTGGPRMPSAPVIQ